MAKFNNTKNEMAAQASLSKAAAVCFTLSTVSSAVAIWAGAMAFLDTKFDASGSVLASIGVFAAVLYFCYLVDFFGISKVGKLFFTEVAAWSSQAFEKFGALRFIAMGLWASIFASFFMISFFTSYHGSDIVKSIAAPKADVASFERIGDARQKAQAQVTAPYEAKREKVEAARKAELANAGTPELRKLARKGDNWANTELLALQAKINKKYDGQLAQIDKDARADKASFEASQGALDAAKLQAAQSALDGQKAQADAIGVVTLAGGVAPLIIGVIIIGVMSVTEVAAAVEKAGKGASVGGQNTQAQPNGFSAANHSHHHFQNFP